MEPICRIPPDWTLSPVVTPLSEVVDPFQEFLGIAELQSRGAGKMTGLGGAQRPLKFAVLDTGIDVKHPDLRDQIIDASDFSRSMFGVDDRVGHGTWCAGAIAAAANDFGVRGIAYDAALLIAKVLGDNGSGSDSAIGAGLAWAYKRGADVYSLSLGGGQMSASVHALFAEVSQQPGKFIFCASGNDSGPVNYPAAWPEVIAVGAVDAQGNLTRFTSRGRELDILAPGVEIVSTIPGGRHGTMTGTSMATPIAAAVGGLVYAEAFNNNRSPELDDVNEMIAILRRTGRCQGGDECAYPLVDPRRLAKEFAPVVPPVVPTFPAAPFESVIVYAGGKAWKASGSDWEPVT